jgi:hypothetical protein
MAPLPPSNRDSSCGGVFQTANPTRKISYVHVRTTTEPARPAGLAAPTDRSHILTTAPKRISAPTKSQPARKRNPCTAPRRGPAGNEREPHRKTYAHLSTPPRYAHTHSTPGLRPAQPLPPPTAAPPPHSPLPAAPPPLTHHTTPPAVRTRGHGRVRRRPDCRSGEPRVAPRWPAGRGPSRPTSAPRGWRRCGGASGRSSTRSWKITPTTPSW